MATIRKSRAKFATGGAVADDVVMAEVPSSQAGAARVAPSQAVPETSDPIDSLRLPEQAKDYLRKHPDCLTDPDKNQRLQDLHWKLVDKGVPEYSEDYFRELDIGLEHFGDAMIAEARAAAERAKPNVRPALDEDEYFGGDNGVLRVSPSRRMIVSAPPSREVPTGDGRRYDSQIRLSPAQKEAAKIAGISERSYAENLLELNRRKSQGDYGSGGG